VPLPKKALTHLSSSRMMQIRAVRSKPATATRREGVQRVNEGPSGAVELRAVGRARQLRRRYFGG
jgi:hypothetical protein